MLCNEKNINFDIECRCKNIKNQKNKREIQIQCYGNLLKNMNFYKVFNS